MGISDEENDLLNYIEDVLGLLTRVSDTERTIVTDMSDTEGMIGAVVEIYMAENLSKVHIINLASFTFCRHRYYFVFQILL